MATRSVFAFILSMKTVTVMFSFNEEKFINIAMTFQPLITKIPFLVGAAPIFFLLYLLLFVCYAFIPPTLCKTTNMLFNILTFIALRTT